MNIAPYNYLVADALVFLSADGKHRNIGQREPWAISIRGYCTVSAQWLLTT